MGALDYLPRFSLSRRWTLALAICLGCMMAGGFWLRRRRKRREHLQLQHASMGGSLLVDKGTLATPLHSLSRSISSVTNSVSHGNRTNTQALEAPHSGYSNPQTALIPEEDLSAEELFAKGQEAFQTAIRCWSQSKQKSENPSLTSHITSLLEEAQHISSTSVSIISQSEATMMTAQSGPLNDSDDADSYHSLQSDFEESEALNSLQNDPSIPLLYHHGCKMARQGEVPCRILRTAQLDCPNDEDFLAKLFGVRQAFNHLLKSPEAKAEFVSVGQDVMTSFLKVAGKDPKDFYTPFNDLMTFVEDPSNWLLMEEELKERGVAELSFYDIVLDFTLMDAFDDLDRLPLTIQNVLQNRWLTNGMKESALRAGIWTMIKAKKSMLKHSAGFMMKFYSVSEVTTPVLAWSFLGSNTVLVEKSRKFKELILSCLRCIFSADQSRYNSKEVLAEDIHSIFRETTTKIKRELSAQSITSQHEQTHTL